MAGGRPSTYTREVIDKAWEYLDKWESLGDMIPSNEGLAEYIDRADSTIYKWAQEEGKEEFSDILCRIKSLQKRTLLNKGLSGDFNAAITKLALGKHGMHESREISGPNGGAQEHKWQIEVVDVVVK